MIQFERETWRDPEVALRREWLETNGLGGFASSTIVGLNTRRPVGRLVLLSKLEETLWIDGNVSICPPTAIQVLSTRKNFTISNSFASIRFRCLPMK